MERRRIGASEIEASVVGLGCNNFGMKLDETQSHAVIAAALDAGIDFFDTADMYGGTKSEAFIGSFGERDRMVLATKFGGLAQGSEKPFADAEAITGFLEDSLRRLRTDHVDLYQLHYPDADTPIEETLGALADVVRSGKARSIGCSNFTKDMIEEAQTAAKSAGAGFVSVQNEWSLLVRGAEEEVVPACERGGLSMLPYFPLASGLLTGKYRRGEAYPGGSRLAAMPDYFAAIASDENFDRLEQLERFAAEAGHTLLDLAFGWLATQPSVASVIAGATTPEQVRINAAAAAVRLTEEDLREIDGRLASSSA